VDVSLRPGKWRGVEVSGESLPQVETTSTVVGGTLTSETIEHPGEWPDNEAYYLNRYRRFPDQISARRVFRTFSMNGCEAGQQLSLDGTE